MSEAGCEMCGAFSLRMVNCSMLRKNQREAAAEQPGMLLRTLGRELQMQPCVMVLPLRSCVSSHVQVITEHRRMHALQAKHHV